MKTIKIAILVFTIGLSYLLLRSFFGSPDCESEVVRRAISPDNKHEAIVATEQCKKRAGPELRLSIVNRATPGKSIGVIIGAASTTDIDVVWLSGSRLQFSFPTSFKVTQQPSEIGGIEISFVPKVSSNSSLHTDAPRR
jgi:hypothetical protein